MLLAMTAACSQPGDIATIEAIDNAAAKLDAAFETGDAETIRSLMTPDHIAVSPYYGAPQTVAEQIASLDDFEYAQTDVGEPTVTLLGPETAIRTGIVDLKGSYKGQPLPARLFATEIMVKRDGKWLERLYQATALTP
jgi:ketosteroid isomerase-like protein